MTTFFVIFLLGQVPKPETLRNSEVIDLIHDKTKYMLHVTKSGPNTYYVIMNESSLEVSIQGFKDSKCIFGTKPIQNKQDNSK